ncbi:MAG: class IV adenylate cyclase [Gemmatimonadota bacterium]
MEEFELKARLEEGPEPLRQRLEAAGWRLCFRGEMRDRRFDTPGGELERRDEVLRLRSYLPEEGPARDLVSWKGPAREVDGFKLREELETRVERGGKAREILARLGFPSVSLAIDRRVEVYEKEGVQVRIEEYPRMDRLVEIEGAPAQVEERLVDLGLPREAWRPWPLSEFVARFEARTGRRARLCRPVAAERAPPDSGSPSRSEE